MQVLSSLSGLQFSAASAGFAPTNSADVSAIASAYQVVSATATQLNAGTAYLTSVNETPISAARAGNAANASLATSAWYDGTGRMISALPDEATVSSIASAYAESAASGKLDESATADFYSTSNPSGFITGVDLSDYATTAYVDSSVSSFVDSAYVESQVSGKEDKLTFSYDDDDKVSAINGSALAGQGGGGLITAIGTSENGITSLNNSGIIDTAALHSADYSSLYVQEPLYISSTGDSSYIGISGNIDSATCSAIASAYAESAASSKQDTLTFGYDTANAISSIDGSALAGGGGGGGGADWSAESGQPGYIENKPVPKTLVAGTGITITENSTALIVASTNTLYTAGSGLTLNGTTFAVDPTAVQGKLTYDYDASGNISGIDGSSLAGSDPEATDLYVQAPLYTGVSGGSAYIGWNNETVLYSDYTGRPTNTGDTIALNESPLNFQYVEVFLNGVSATSNAAGWANSYQKIDTVTLSSVPGLTFVGLLSGNSTWWDVGCAYTGVSSTTWTKVLGYTKQVNSTAAGMMDNVNHLNIWKVVGLNRTAGE